MATKSWTKDEIVSVRVKDEVKARLEKEAQDEGVSLAELVRRKLESTKNEAKGQRS
jgi:predicted HicB family RNase H-like nuclease